MTLFTHRTAGGRCPCGAANAACGPPSGAVPVDQRIEEVAAVSGPLQKYRVVRGGVETVMKLNDADAARLGLGAGDVLGSAVLQGEHGPEIIAFSGDGTVVQERKATAPNKARQTSSNKAGRSPRKTAPPVPAEPAPAAPGGDEQGDEQEAPQGGGDGGPGGGD